MVKKAKNIAFQTLKIAFSVAIIYWLVQSGKLNFTALRNLLSPGIAAISLALVGANLFLASERWRMLLTSQGLKPKIAPAFKLSLIGSFFNFAMPGGVGGDVIKAYYFTRDNPGSKVVAVTSVLMDRVLGLFSMILMALLVMIYDLGHITREPTLKTLFGFILGLFLAFSFGLAIVFSKKLYDGGLMKKLITKLPLSQKFMKLYESMHLYGNHGPRILGVILISLLAQTFTIFFLYIVGGAAGFPDVPLKTYFLVAPLGFMATAIPISPAGVGVGQAAFYFLFNLYLGSSSEIGPTTITAFQVCSFIFSLSGAYFYMRYKQPSDITNAEEMT